MSPIQGDQIPALMDNASRIRHVAVVGSISSGKSTLVRTLLSDQEVIDEEMTTKSTSYPIISTHSLMQDASLSEKYHYLVNVTDTPGHVEFFSEASSTLHISDGVLVVVDVLDGMSGHTETLLRQACIGRVKPVLVINKLDLLQSGYSLEQGYNALVGVVDAVNVVHGAYKDGQIDDWRLSPQKGSVVFGSGRQGWGFTLDNFAKLYANKFGVDEKKMTEKLWGNWYFDPNTEKWTQENNVDGTLKRAFCQFVLKPIRKLYHTAHCGGKVQLEKMLKTIGVELDVDEKELLGTALFERIMQQWLPLKDTVLKAVLEYLPSPVVAQKYRVETVYTGRMDDECANAIRECDVVGPLVMYVSKLVRIEGCFYALGRVFAGKVTPGTKVRLLGRYTQPNLRGSSATVEDTLLVLGRDVHSTSVVPAGNTCCLSGIDTYMNAPPCTLTTFETGKSLHVTKFSVAPAIRVSVEAVAVDDIAKLVTSMKRLAKLDPSVECREEDSGLHMLCCTGEKHLEMCLKTLQEELMKSKVRFSDPIPMYCETVTSKSSQTCLAKSPNKHNRLYCVGLPLGEPLTTEISIGRTSQVSSLYDSKRRANYLASHHDWEVSEARRIWCYGPDGRGPNILVDTTKGVCYLAEIKESMVGGFQWATMEGVLCGEALRGLRVNIVDVGMFSDAIHRGMGQILPTTRRVVYACQLTASPALMEAMYHLDFSCSLEMVDGSLEEIKHRRGHVLRQAQHPLTQQVRIQAHLPVNESFGLVKALRLPPASVQMTFSHYAAMRGDPTDPSSPSGGVVEMLRRRADLPPEVPPLGKFLDSR